MLAQPVIAIVDVGKTNKKILLFNEQYEMVFEQTTHLDETTDEDGFACEDLQRLNTWLHEALHLAFKQTSFYIKAINIAAYGASLVYVNESGEPLLPLYNYLKPYPPGLQQQLYDQYGGEEIFTLATASPALGSLNSGLQLYRIKHEKPALFAQVKWALHLPQYLSYQITGEAASDLTSVGCHTALWDFEKKDYHLWVAQENIGPKLAPIKPCAQTNTTNFFKTPCAVGIGLHDSSAALIPYQSQATAPFVLLSTGTWCIALNPFNETPLTVTELAQDCLCYLDYNGRPVKAARLFLGPQFDSGVARICEFFHQDSAYYRNITFDKNLLLRLNEKRALVFDGGPFLQQQLHRFEDGIEAYYALLLHLMQQQQASLKLVLQPNTKQIFVDGGFSQNDVYMHLLAAAFPEQSVYAASMAQGTALGAALAIHTSWNTQPLPQQLVQLRRVPPRCVRTL